MADPTETLRARKVPPEFTTGGDRYNAGKAWLDGYDAASQRADAAETRCRTYGRHTATCALTTYAVHRDWCAKWKGFHEQRSLDETVACTCPRRTATCTCGFDPDPPPA
jgi:hypothetical protein